MFSWMDDNLADLRRRNLHRSRRRIQRRHGAHVWLNGREFIGFASNDYLGLSGDSRLARAAAHVARRYGCGAGASPLVSGFLPAHRALERALARWEGADAALVFSSGFVANLCLAGTLAGEGDAIFSDALNHASLIDGCRLSRARVHVYRHADTSHLHDLLTRLGGASRRRLIVTESVFSMDGDWAPLTELADLARCHDCLLLIDEAHATGIFGENGRGLSELLSVSSTDQDSPIKVGTLSKALGGQGGFVTGSRRLIDWLVNRGRPYIFSTALAPPLAAAARQAVAVVAAEPERRHRLLGLADFLRERLGSVGYPATGSRCQIVPVVVGSARAALEMSRRLQERGLLVPAIRPPTVPEGTARLRISLTAQHSEEDVARLVAALAEAARTRGSASHR
jgi:8-amino-7-oxononanoate synthase